MIIDDYMADLMARVKAGAATKEEQEAAAKAMREQVDAENAQYIRALNLEQPGV
jgi:hypothetical protein